MKKIYTKIKKILYIIINIIQKILIVFFLTLVYTFMFGITYIFMLLFSRKTLIPLSFKSDSNWRKAAGYGIDTHDISRQS
ncbi:MAG: hypothetical protein GF375_04660 [Candidatus Omnitrophica bacterium]|nr:hypothetical protein [Candidatus Omnitrophota bacterium]MBD3269319.1 hypothetical protein [Candidatus Omnitrophota bacterium]